MFQPERKKRQERLKLGVEMNQFYQSSSVYIEEEPLEVRKPKYNRDKKSYYTAGTLSDMQLPHTWVTT